jgi:hypothetical protein
VGACGVPGAYRGKGRLVANGDAGWRWGAGQEQWQPARGGHGDDGQRWHAAGQAWGGPNGTRPLRWPAPDERGYPSAGPGAGASVGPPGTGTRQGSVMPRRMMLAVLGAVVIGSAGAIAATASPKALASGGRRRPEAGEDPAASSRARTRQPGRGAPVQPEYYIHDGPRP